MYVPGLGFFIENGYSHLQNRRVHPYITHTIAAANRSISPRPIHIPIYLHTQHLYT